MIDAADLALLSEGLRSAMAEARSAAGLDAALAELGWRELLEESPDEAVALVFGLLGETGAHAPVLNDVLLHAMKRPLGGVVALREDGLAFGRPGEPSPADLDPALGLCRVAWEPLTDEALAAGRRALGLQIVGAGRTMLALAREHALARTQFGRPVAAFQAVRHRLAETLVALEGAQAALEHATDPMTAKLGKALAGRAGLTAMRHCQQVLAGIGFTAEHRFHLFARRVLVLDDLLGSASALTREIGESLEASRIVPRLVDL
ncbi:Acyl-CoA dehydrogenase, C-terminal domain [Thermomonospora echinospora]|uniref:Acyl-CoA dehydrogenase, C-terminal domain n=1 Tax=Thermomonospora echinospora TaxID=1992 RepID=A0A1H6DJ33_9ACTN|nr:acyl-CoA dehydrogenase family protein [Thermomonospora echinospora]SEG85181.1 Acyl-CoA dehydrogenase, C-terminal domain [Thermomonospora echinospora]